ncbi:MAG: tripartite tricarboxylate transporter substrate binding protein [Betaproteobacteria bacterium]|jgi:tripartite-type tricarboxylate transporter receptor subunit TctC|nr:tripartite tricarboxylate transporter substrate binding protein [Betaproteobacteria bacterium]
MPNAPRSDRTRLAPARPAPRRSLLRRTLGLLLGFTLLPAVATAQAYPDRPVRLVVPFAAGGIVDITARQVGQKLAERLGQPVIIDNRPGASGSIGTEFVAKAPADGYTLLMAFDTHAVNPLIYKDLKFDTFKDFAPVSLVGTIPLVFASSAAFPAKTVADLLAQAKARPGGLSYGSVGAGSSGHLAAEQFKVLSNAEMVHVPFKGGAPALTALMGDQIHLLVFAAGVAVPQIRAGKVTGLAVTGTARSKALPAVPTMAEAGYPQLNSGAWMGILAPAGTPAAVVSRLQVGIAAAVADPAIAERLAEQAVELRASSASEFGSFIKAEHDKWSKVIKDARLDLRP